MAEDRARSHEVFGDEDLLRLLQLMTRRAMSEADARRKASGDSQEAIGAEEDATLNVAVPPQRWTLIPEGTSLYGWQRDCLSRWLAAGRGTVKVATGGGKTLLALAAAQQLQNDREPNLRLVVVVPTIPLMLQWFDEVRRGNLPEWSIGLMGGGRRLQRLTAVRVLICVLNSARDQLPQLVAKEGWGAHTLLVVDECHRSNAEQARRIFEANPMYTLGLSATPEQEQEAEGVPPDAAYEQGAVGKALGPIIYEFTLRQSLEAGLLTPFEIWHIGLSLSPEESIQHAQMSREIAELRKPLQFRHRRSASKQGFLAWCQTQVSRGGAAAAETERFIGLSNARKRLLYRARARTQVALSILTESASDPASRAIVFHESIEEIERLFLRALEVQLPAVLEHSRLPDTVRAENIDAFRRGVARVIISAKSLVEGFNVPSADLGIIAASSGSVRQRIQSLGRMLRRKPGGRTARVIVLYIRDTEDESIYERADWENVIGAERNRYFSWHEVEEGEPWTRGLEETARAPRIYRPPSFEIDGSELCSGDPYPAQVSGLDLKVDTAGTLRTEDGVLVPAKPELVEAILAHSLYRRARRTPAGHLIVRVDARGDREDDWRFLGAVGAPEEGREQESIRLRFRQSMGRREISREEDRRRGIVRFALGPGKSKSAEAGQARDRLLAWVHEIEQSRDVSVREIFWDGARHYWLEIRGERISYEGSLAPLEFSR